MTTPATPGPGRWAEEQITWQDKGFLHPQPEPTPVGEFLDAGHSLFDGSFSWPVLTLRESALAHNLSTLAEFTREHGLLFAPHGKTMMSPALWQRQLDAGAWAITLATPAQVVVALRCGLSRVLVANEILDPTALRWLAGELAADPTLEVFCYVDSLAGVDAIMSAMHPSAGTAVPAEFGVLVELGYPGGRTGCRDQISAIEVASAAQASSGVTVAGVAGYEGGLSGTDQAAAHLREVQELANTLFLKGILAPDAIVTAGGSAFFDVLAEAWSDGWAEGFRPRRVLRSGAYLSHDHGTYVGKTPFTRIDGTLEGAIELWAQVLSAGDPGQVIVGMGRRDAPHDAGLPVPLAVRRSGSEAVSPLTGEVTRLDDHHGYLQTSDPLRPGDLVCFGISHPCTAFDKWPLIPVLDDDRRVVDIVRTYF